MEYLIQYGLFFAKVATLVIAILILIAGILSIASKGGEKGKGRIKIKKLNKKYSQLKNQLQAAILPKNKLKQFLKDDKKAEKALAHSEAKQPRKRMFVLSFAGDMRASQVEQLREEITAVLAVATPEDEIVLCLESGGGLVHAYGLGASQLTRIRERNIPLTIVIDKVAASGGYMMAAVANKIVAAPFSLIGSIGVLAQFPNFHRFLKHHNIEFEQLSAGEYKRTLTLFGENSSKARKKMQEDLEEIHVHFKDFITQYRSQLDIDKVATGEYWLGTRAFELKLIDKLGTSDDYLIQAANDTDIFSIEYKRKKSIAEKLSSSAQLCFQKILAAWCQENDSSRFL